MIDLDVEIALSLPEASFLMRSGGHAAQDVVLRLKGSYPGVASETSLSLWPHATRAEVLVFRARVAPALVSALGGEKPLTDQIARMLVETAQRLSRESA